MRSYELILIGKGSLSDSLRKKLIGRGFEQAGKFSWRKTAEETLKIYKTQV